MNSKILNGILLILVIMLFSACADSKTFVINGKEVVAEPYGWANEQSRRVNGVVYEANVGNVIWSIILIETIFVPIWLTGWELFEPVRYEPAIQQEENSNISF